MEEKKWDDSDLRQAIAKLYASKTYIELQNGIHQTDIFKILGISRSEVCHSQFIAWILDPNGLHGLEEYPLRRLMLLLSLKMDDELNKNAKLSKDLCESFMLDNYKIDWGDKYQVITEYSIPEKKSRLDILIKNIHLELKRLDEGKNAEKKKKTIFILIENKILSSEGDGQTAKYYEWAADIKSEGRPDGVPVCVFLTPGKESKNRKPECDKFITITYQDLADYVIEPCMKKTESEISKIYISEYLKTIGYSKQQEKDKKGELVMAYSENAKNLCSAFVQENQDLFRYIASVLNEIDIEDSGVNEINDHVSSGSSAVDRTKYLICIGKEKDDNNGKGYGKRRIALKIAQEAEKKYNTKDEFMKLFKNSFDKFVWGKNNILVEATEVKTGNGRFFADVFKLGGKEYRFTNQWGGDSFDELLKIAEEKLNIKVEKM